MYNDSTSLPHRGSWSHCYGALMDLNGLCPHYRGTTSWSYHVLTTEGTRLGPTMSSLQREHVLVLQCPHYRGNTSWSYHVLNTEGTRPGPTMSSLQRDHVLVYNVLTTEGPHPGPTMSSLQRDHVLVLPRSHYTGTTSWSTTSSLQRDHPHCTLGGVYGRAHLARICRGLSSHRHVFPKLDKSPLCPFRLF